MSRPLILVLLLLGSPLMAHETSDMHEVESLAGSWLTGLQNGKGKSLGSLLTDDATADVDLASRMHFDSREAFLSYLQPMLNEFKVQDMSLDSAFFDPRGGGVRIGPLVTQHGFGANVPFAWFLDARETPGGWKITHVGVSVEGVPKALLQVDRPERHSGRAIRIKVVDSATAQPLASRVNIRDSNGRYWPPRGHQYEIPTGWREDVGGDVKVDNLIFAYVEPEFTVDLPEGRYSIESRHGLEYVPRVIGFDVTAASADVTAASADVTAASADVTVKLDRWVDMNADGWFSGDTHVHFVRPHSAALEARGEGVNVVNILAAKWGNLITSVDDFTGAPDAASTDRNIVYVNEEARHLFLGHTALLGLRQLVFPLSWGSGPLTGVPGGIDYPPMANLADEAHAQGGLVAWAHFPGPRGEVAVDIGLGKIDSVDVLTWGDPLQRKNGEPSRVDAWYGFLNCGFRLPITAGTDKMFNTQVIGTPRVYVQLNENFSYDAWLDGIRNGRTFATTGPVVSLSVDDQPIGAVLTRKAGSHVVVSAHARSQLPITRLEIIQNGVVVATGKRSENRDDISISARVRIDTSSWLAARVLSDSTLPYQTVYLDRSEDIPVFAHTSPVYVDVPGKPRRSATDARLFIKWIDEGLDWLRQRAVIPEASERQEMVSLFERARAVYVSQVTDKAVATPGLSRQDVQPHKK